MLWLSQRISLAYLNYRLHQLLLQPSFGLRRMVYRDFVQCMIESWRSRTSRMKPFFFHSCGRLCKVDQKSWASKSNPFQWLHGSTSSFLTFVSHWIAFTTKYFQINVRRDNKIKYNLMGNNNDTNWMEVMIIRYQVEHRKSLVSVSSIPKKEKRFI